MSFTGQLGSGDSQLGNISLGELSESASYSFGQAQALILQTYRGYGQAQADILQTYNGFGQAQASINTSQNGFGQAQASILQTYNACGQAQGQIKQTYNSFAQAQAQIKQVYHGFGQAQGYISAPFRAYAQAQAWICWTDTFSVATAYGLNTDFWHIVDYDSEFFDNPEDSPYRVDGTKLISDSNTDFDSYELNDTIPTEATITFDVFIPTGFTGTGGFFGGIFGEGYGLNVNFLYVTVQEGKLVFSDGSTPSAPGFLGTYIDPVEENKLYHFKYGYNSVGNVGFKVWKDGDSEPFAWGKIASITEAYGDYDFFNTIWLDLGFTATGMYVDNFRICTPEPLFFPYAFGQAQALINARFGLAQAQAKINSFNVGRFGQARARIIAPTTRRGLAQAQARIKQTYRSFGQAQALINQHWGFGQAKAQIKVKRWQWAQAQAWISIRAGYAQAQAYITAFNTYRSGQAQGQIKQTYHRFAQAQAWIGQSLQTGQAQALISSAHKHAFGQAQAKIIRSNSLRSGQAQARIVSPRGRAFGQAQARITSFNSSGFGQAQASILRTLRHGNAQAFIVRNDAGRLVKFNGYYLPGYLQYESLPSEMTIEAHIARTDGSLSEYTGLTNKFIDIRMKVAEPTYAQNKEKIFEAGTLLRSNRSGFSPLFVKHTDKYYLALTRQVNSTAKAGEEKRVDYSVTFECKPWLYGSQTHQLSDDTLLDTNIVGRTYLDGTWTPVRLNITGTNVTVSGYTETGDFTGFISVSGNVSNLSVDTENFDVKLMGQKRNDLINNYDYAMYVGPGRTFFAITGAVEVTIEYEDRWTL